MNDERLKKSKTSLKDFMNEETMGEIGWIWQIFCKLNYIYEKF